MAYGASFTRLLPSPWGGSRHRRTNAVDVPDQILVAFVPELTAVWIVVSQGPVSRIPENSGEPSPPPVPPLGPVLLFEPLEQALTSSSSPK